MSSDTRNSVIKGESNMKLISYENKHYFCFEAKILGRSLGITMSPANDKDINQIEKAIKCIRTGTPIDAKCV
jgi:hypothetical protein